MKDKTISIEMTAASDGAKISNNDGNLCITTGCYKFQEISLKFGFESWGTIASYIMK
jgi:hypothetical protein